MDNCYLIDFGKVGDNSLGYISVAQSDKLPFEVKRICWTYFMPEHVSRGNHAHYKTQQILVAMSGIVTVVTESANSSTRTFKLDDPAQGLYIPPNVWHTMQYSDGAVQLLLASTLYDENDYIRDYNKFMEIWMS